MPSTAAARAVVSPYPPGPHPSATATSHTKTIIVQYTTGEPTGAPHATRGVAAWASATTPASMRPCGTGWPDINAEMAPQTTTARCRHPGGNRIEGKVLVATRLSRPAHSSGPLPVDSAEAPGTVIRPQRHLDRGRPQRGHLPNPGGCPVEPVKERALAAASARRRRASMTSSSGSRPSGIVNEPEAVAHARRSVSTWRWVNTTVTVVMAPVITSPPVTQNERAGLAARRAEFPSSTRGRDPAAVHRWNGQPARRR
jgi:hypothetical protein